jgi:hypothetical protein
VDWYKKLLNHFGWTWLEHKRCKFIDGPRRKDKHPTRLARAFAKKQTRKEIDES